VDSGSWTSGTPIVVSLDDLYYGTYHYSIIVYDVAGNYVEDSVIVEVYPMGRGIIQMILDNLLYIGVGLVVLVGAIVFLRKRS
jgi:hypothetical protein